MQKLYYGVSSTNYYGNWEHYVVVFDDYQRANKWLHTEDRDFRKRELMNREEAVKLAGEKAVVMGEIMRIPPLGLMYLKG